MNACKVFCINDTGDIERGSESKVEKEFISPHFFFLLIPVSVCFIAEKRLILKILFGFKFGKQMYIFLGLLCFCIELTEGLQKKTDFYWPFYWFDLLKCYLTDVLNS